jgi:hypothetical protein
MKKSTLSYSLLALLSIGFRFSGYGQNVAINTSGNNAYSGALLDLSNNNTAGQNGFLPPYVALTNTPTSLLPVVGVSSQLSGLIVYNTSANLSGPGLYTWFYNTGTPALSAWVFLGSGSPISGAGTLNFLARWTPNGSTLGIGVTQDNGTSVGINTAPVATQMLTSAQAAAANIAILGQNTAANGVGAGIGIEGITAQSGGYGVYGQNTATGAGAIGVYGITSGAGSAGIGVKGNSTVTGGTGVEGANANPGASGGFGVQGLITGSGGGQEYGVFGNSAVTVGNGYGVAGSATGATTINYGGFFSAANGTNNYGVVVPINGGFTGLYTSTPQSTLDVFGSEGSQISGVAITANTTLDGTYSTILANPTAGAFTITLPTAGPTNIRRKYTIVYSPSAATANAVTIQPTAGNIYTGVTPNVSLSLIGGSITVQSNGASWYTTDDWSGNINPLAGAGTLNYLSRWTPNGSTLGNGITQDNGTEVGISAAAYCFCAGNGLLDVIGNATNVTAIEGTTPQSGGYGIEGLNTATSGAPIGVYGAANGVGSSGIGVEGNSLITGGTGVQGISNNLGVSGGTAVSGLMTGNGGGQQYALYGQSTVTAGNGYGVYGNASGVGAAINYGGYFSAAGGTTNYGVVVPNAGGFTGLYTTTPQSTLDVFGSVGTQISAAALTANTTLDGTYSSVLVNPVAGAFTVTLPSAGGTNIRRFYTIVYAPTAVTANVVTIQALAGSIYTGSTANASLPLIGGSITVQSNGANWFTTNDWTGGTTPLSGAGTLNYLARWTPNGTTLGIGVTQDNGTTVGINTAPVATQMLTSAQTTAANIAILGENTAALGASTGIGVEGTTIQSLGFGVLGNNTATGAGAVGVEGTANGAGSAGIGVKGNSTITGGTGVEGVNANPGVSGGFGVQGLISGAGGGQQYALYGASTVTAGNGYGVNGQATGAAAINYGGNFTASNATGNNYGVNSSVTGGAGSTNYAGYFNATGAGTDYGVVVPAAGGNSGFGTAAPVSTTDINGSYGVGTTNISPAAASTTALGAGYSTVLATPSAVATTYTLTLPSAALSARRIYTIVYYGSGLGTIDITSPVSGAIKENGATIATFALAQGSVTLQSDGANWEVLNVTTSNTFGSFVGIKYVTVTTAATAFDAGTNSVLVKVIGGGGAGSGGSTTGACAAQTDYAGTGGGAGGYVEGFLNGLTGSSTYAVTIGAGGAGTAACNTAGGSGGNTVLTITNPATTYTGNGGVGGLSNEANNVDSYKAGGAGGTATSTAAAGTYITIPGATGASSVISSTGIHLCASGCGAGTTFGPGGSALTGRSLVQAGVSAVAFGAGGGGAINAQTPGSNSAGGNGYQGVVIIYEYQ